MGNIKVTTIELPAHWAPMLINGDTSGMEQDDKDTVLGECATLRAEYPGARIVSCDDDTFIARYNGLQTDMLTYVVHYDGREINTAVRK